MILLLRTLNISKEIELLLGSFGAIQSAFLAIYLFAKKRNVPNSLLGFFFFLITIRIIKSLLWVYLDDVPNWFMNLGFIAHFATGPSLFLYFLYFIKQKPWNRVNYLHFIPAIFLLPFLFKLNLNNFWYQGGYAFLLYHQLVYTILTLGVLMYYLIKKKHILVLDKKSQIWLGILFIGTASIQLAYFSNYILDLTPYLAGPVIYALFIYITAFFGFINQDVLDREKMFSKYRNINLTEEEFSFYKNKIIKIMKMNKPYLDSDFTLNVLSKKISLPSNLTSYIINKGFDTNFSDFANFYRIDDAKAKLVSSAYFHIKISEVAYECGFNTLSSFNTAFKKNVGTTPSQFKNSNNM